MAFIIKNMLQELKNRNDLIDLEQLKKSFNLLTENVSYGQLLAQTGSWTHDIQKDVIFISEEVYRILECSSQEVNGKFKNYYVHVHPDDLEEVKAATQGALKGKEYDLEYRIITPDGTTKYVHEKTRALYDDNNNPIKMVGIIQDITNRKLIENKLIALGDELNQA